MEANNKNNQLSIPSEQHRLLKRKSESSGPVDVFVKRPKQEATFQDLIYSSSSLSHPKEHLNFATTGDQKVVRIASAPETGDFARAKPVRAVVSNYSDRAGMSVMIKPSLNSISDDDDYSRDYRETEISAGKPCNCSKSRCLKLYCECFAAGVLCQNCNCVDCHNTPMHASERNAAVKSLLSRNPTAFKPKIEEQSHQRGCNCRKSGCLKNYCECYGAGIPCSVLCRCEGCRNTDAKFDRRRDRPYSEYSHGSYMRQRNWKNVMPVRDERRSKEEFEEFIMSRKERILELQVDCCPYGVRPGN